MTLALNQYNDIIASAAEIATIAHQRDSFPRDALKEKRNHIIEILRRTSEQEELALHYIQKTAALLTNGELAAAPFKPHFDEQKA